MKVNFNKKQVAVIAQHLQTYKKMFVTSSGQMFTVEKDALAAVRAKNAILGDPNTYEGVATLTENMVTVEKLKTYAKDLNLFNELFKDAVIPLEKEAKKNFEKKLEKPTTVDKKVKEDVENALGLGAQTQPENPETPAEPQETKEKTRK